MKLGYACINLSLNKKFRSCRVVTAEKEGIPKLKELTLENLRLTKEIMEWNIKHNILFYRMSSNIVVLATHQVNTWNWSDDPDVLEICSQIKQIKDQYGSRLSMHPGQYSVLNSPREEVIANTLSDLHYHADLMDLTGATDMILHLGGEYGNKEQSIRRFVKEAEKLPENIFNKLRLENDDKTFNLEDVLQVCEKTGIPACFDIHHHFCNPCEGRLEDLLDRVWDTWKRTGTPKVHISSGKEFPTDRRHHDFIHPEDFNRLICYLNGQDADIMVEAKSKDLAVLRLQEKT